MSGILASELPDLGAVTDASFVVGVKGGTGSFDAQALKAYVQPLLSDYPPTGAAVTDATTFAGIHQTASVNFPAGALRAYMLQGLAVLPRDFGAIGDGVADDTAALQAAINYLLPRGGVLDLGVGTYKTSATLTINESGVTTDDKTHVSIVGAGRGATTILATQASGPALLLQGGATGEGLHSHQRLQGFRITGNGLCNGISGDNLAFLTIEEVQVRDCVSAFALTDVASSVISNCLVKDNRYGFLMQRLDVAFPTAIQFSGCFIVNNTEYGVLAVGPTALTMVGGKVEGNGWGLTGPSQWGVKVDNAGYEGGGGISLLGVHFAGNQGVADLWIDQQVNSAAYSVTGCTFYRFSSANYVTRNIYAQTAGAEVHLSVQGCAFKGGGSYVEDVLRPYFTISEFTHCDFGQANYYGSSLAAPRFSATPDFCAGLTGTPAIADSTWVTAPLDQGVWDAQGNYDPAALQFTTRRRCRVAVQAQVYLKGLVAGAEVQVAFETSTGASIRKAVHYAAGAEGCFALNATIEADAATFYRLRVRHTGGAGVTFQGGASADVTFLQVRAA